MSQFAKTIESYMRQLQSDAAPTDGTAAANDTSAAIVLDANALRTEIATLELLRTLKSEFGKTVVMVTHDPRGERYVDEVHYLDKGLLLETRAGGVGAGVRS